MTAEAIDWAAAMTATQQSAEKAAALTERTIGGVAELLQQQSRHSSALSDATKRMATMEAQLGSLIEQERATRATITYHSRSPVLRANLAPLLALSAAVGALVASVVSLLS